MRLIQTDIRIAAPRETVWDVLLGFADYPRWNPFIRQILGEPRAGARLALSIQTPGGRRMTFRPTVTLFEPGRELRWVGRLGVPGVFDGEHRFLVERISDDAARLVHEERFNGALVPFVWARLAPRTLRGFEQMNAALKQVAEGRACGLDPDAAQYPENGPS